MSAVRATLTFLAPDAEHAVYTASVGGGAVGVHEGRFTAVDVSIEDGRAGRFDLDVEGFAAVPHAFEGRNGLDWYDDSALRRHYEPHVVELLKHHTGADDVLVFDHTRRSASPTVRSAHASREPSATVHNDYTAWSGPNRLALHLADEPERLAAVRRNRFAIVNVWRSIAGPVETMPLALCDARTCSPAARVDVERKSPDGRRGEVQFVKFEERQRWVRFDRLRPDEALLIKTFDTDPGRARSTPHTAFADPRTPADSQPRESLETRCFCVFT